MLTGPVVLIAAILGVAGAAVAVYVNTKKRVAMMRALAEKHRFTFEEDGRDLHAELGNFKVFAEGSSKKVANLMSGAKDAGTIRVCDYQYTTGSGKQRSVHHLTICVLQSQGHPAPHFFARREHPIVDRLGSALGGQDLDFEDDPEFSKAYVLQTNGALPPLIEFMCPRLRQTLTELAEHDLELEASGDTLVVHRRRVLDAAGIDSLIADTINIRYSWS